MLSFVAEDIKGCEIILPAAIKAVINMEEDVPADDLYVIFPYVELNELKNISVYDGGSLAFAGVVDEEEHIADSSGEYLRISARSLAARLLDNEAIPESYNHPSAGLIYERHVRPYGIRAADADDAVYFGEQVVTKGTSRWTAIRNFCNACYSAVPRISADGVLYMKGLSSNIKTVFSDSGDGLAYTAINESVKRCEEISRVNVKVSSGAGYAYPVANADAELRGIRRERCINAILTDTPLKCADAMIEAGRRKAYSLTLESPERLLNILGSEAQVKSSVIGDRKGLYVSSLKYRMDTNGESTTVVLKRRYA